MASILSRGSVWRSPLSSLSSAKKAVREMPTTATLKKPTKTVNGKKFLTKNPHENPRKRPTKASTSSSPKRHHERTASDRPRLARTPIASAPLAKVTRLIADFVSFRNEATKCRLVDIERYSDEAYTLRMELKMLKRPDFVKVANGGQLRVRKRGSATSGELFDRIADEIKRCKAIKMASRNTRYQVDSRRYHAAAARVSVYMGLLQFLSDRLKSETIKP